MLQGSAPWLSSGCWWVLVSAAVGLAAAGLEHRERGPVEFPAWRGFFLCKCLGAAALPA